MQRFMNRVVRALGLSKDYKTMEMKGVLRQTNLRLRTGLDSVKTRIVDRTLGFLGHMARRGGERLEWKLLHGWLVPESEQPSGHQRGTWLIQVQKWLVMIVEESGEEGAVWHELARETDQRGKHTRWNTLRRKVVQWIRAKEDEDTHDHRDTVRAEVRETPTARPKPKAATERVTCECGSEMAKWSLRNHLALNCPTSRSRIQPTSCKTGEKECQPWSSGFSGTSVN